MLRDYPSWGVGTLMNDMQSPKALVDWRERPSGACQLAESWHMIIPETTTVNYPPNAASLQQQVPFAMRKLVADWLMALPCNYGRAQLAVMLIGPTKENP